jgi:hypothetical protein
MGITLDEKLLTIEERKNHRDGNCGSVINGMKKTG